MKFREGIPLPVRDLSIRTTDVRGKFAFQRDDTAPFYQFAYGWEQDGIKELLLGLPPLRTADAGAGEQNEMIVEFSEVD